MNIVSVADIGIGAAEDLLKKKAFDELTLSDRIRQSNMQIFGEDLSPTALVHRIVRDVRDKGDEALFHYTKLLDRVDLTPDSLMVSEKEFCEAERKADPDVVASLKKAADNIFSYHEEQKPRAWMTYRAHGSILGQVILPLARVGSYECDSRSCCRCWRDHYVCSDQGWRDQPIRSCCRSLPRYS